MPIERNAFAAVRHTRLTKQTMYLELIVVSILSRRITNAQIYYTNIYFIQINKYIYVFYRCLSTHC